MAKNEPQPAWSGMAVWRRWDVSSTYGARLRFGLPNRDDLKTFDQAIKRTKKRAGQRYAVAINDPEVDPNDVLAFEAFFAGCSWSNTAGSSVVLGITEDTLEAIRHGFYCEDEGHGTLMVTMVELAENEDEFIDQRRARKGGPRSQHVARLCKDPDFMLWVAQTDCPELGRSCDFAECDAFIKRRTGVGSKVDFDLDETAWQRFKTNIESPFLRSDIGRLFATHPVK